MFSIWKNKSDASFDYGLLGTDMHSHLVPAVDDGAPDPDTSVKLIKGMLNLGFKKMITTPHIMKDMYPNTAVELRKNHKQLLLRLKDEQIEVELLLAAEYFLDDHVKEILRQRDQLLTMNGNMVLVEFSLANEPIGLKEILFEMELQGYIPVIAHPERYIYHERNLSFFEDLKNSGYLFQLNILSLAGFYGKSPSVLAQQFIKRGFYELAGTDLHGEKHLQALKSPLIKDNMERLVSSGNLLNPFW